MIYVLCKNDNASFIVVREIIMSAKARRIKYVKLNFNKNNQYVESVFSLKIHTKGLNVIVFRLLNWCCGVNCSFELIFIILK